METDIGPTLREARVRRHIDLIEIEKQTKIRVRYLRALENEEWDVLPGPTYTRSFIRTYATFLGLDGERLADDFRRQQDEGLAEAAPSRDPLGVAPHPGSGGRGPRLGAGVITAMVAVGLIAILIVLGLTRDEGDGGSQADGPATTAEPDQRSGSRARPGAVSLRLAAQAEVWVCAVNARGDAVIDGQILSAGSTRGPFRSRRFDLAFGNGGVDFDVNGKPFRVEETPSPVGYRVTAKRTKPLPEGSRPDCA